MMGTQDHKQEHFSYNTSADEKKEGYFVTPIFVIAREKRLITRPRQKDTVIETFKAKA
jgi:hypothetical protein